MMIQIVSMWWIEHVMNDGIHVYWDVYCVVSYEMCNHTIVRSFKGDEYCDGIHCENPMSLITSATS